MVPRKRSKDTFATLPMTGDVTTAAVMAAHFQLCSQAFLKVGSMPAEQLLHLNKHAERGKETGGEQTGNVCQGETD